MLELSGDSEDNAVGMSWNCCVENFIAGYAVNATQC